MGKILNPNNNYMYETVLILGLPCVVGFKIFGRTTVPKY